MTVAGATVGGNLALAGGSTIGQSGAVHAASLNVTTTNGAITLTNAGNTFATATLSTSGTDNASLTDASALTIASANIGGTLTLTGGAGIGQSGAIHAAALNATTTGGAITLTNIGNTFATANLATGGSDNATLYDTSALTISSANVGGTLTLSGGSTIGQSGAIHAASLTVTTTHGDIALTNAANTIGTATLSTAGSDNAALADASALTIASANIGGALTLSGGAAISQSGAIHSGALNVSSTGGAITLTNTGNIFGDATLATSGSNDASLYNTQALTIASANVGGALTLSSGAAIGQSGAIHAATLNVTTTNGDITLANAANTIGSANLTTSGTDDAVLVDASALTLTGADIGGTLTLTGGGAIGQSGAIHAATLIVSTTSGAINLNSTTNAIGSANFATSGSDSATLYDSISLDITGAAVGGTLTLVSQHDLNFVSSAQAKTGILAVAGWDGTTTTPSALVTGNAYGNNGGNIIIGGADAGGDVSVGSSGGTITLAGANVTLAATNGYAQLGNHGAGSAAINVVAKNDVTLTGGAQANYFAQIGNGGYHVSGNESGDISVNAAGDVVLDGGAGDMAYAQIGHGGAQSNSSSSGYSDTGLVSISGKTVTLASGTGLGSYTQIGHGGYLSGQSLAGGTATLGGNITVNALTGVTLDGGGAASYSQIGHGGDLVNSNAADGAGGTTSGNITVAVTSKPTDTSIDPVTATAGSGADSYAQIGNGGSGENSPANGATGNFSVSGNLFIDDLTLRGSDTGANGYAQIGNGDASERGTGNISGDITIGHGFHVVSINGTAPGASSSVGNHTGFGTVSGLVSILDVPPPPPPPPPTVPVDSGGAIATVIQKPTESGATNITVVTVVSDPGLYSGGSGSSTSAPGPIEQMANGDGDHSEGKQASDEATESLGKSLDAGHKSTEGQTLIPGVLAQTASQRGGRGVPPADVDYSSWGNEALWW